MKIIKPASCGLCSMDSFSAENGGFIHAFTLQQGGANTTIEYSNNNANEVNIPLDSWYLYTVVNHHNSHRKQYINGLLVDNQNQFYSKDHKSNGQAVSGPRLDAGPITVGKDSKIRVSPKNSWSEKNDNIRINNRACSENEVDLVYACETNSPHQSISQNLKVQKGQTLNFTIPSRPHFVAGKLRIPA